MHLQGDVLALTIWRQRPGPRSGKHADEPCVKHPEFSGTRAQPDRALSRRNRPRPNDEQITAAVGTAKPREQPIAAVGDATDAILWAERRTWRRGRSTPV
jgi:hypothetical protein